MIGFALALAAAAASSRPVTRYLEHLPSTKIAGISFLGDPQVQEIVRTATGWQVGLSAQLLSSGVELPIFHRANYMVAHICEPHNCGNHNWSIFLDPSNARFNVICYHNGDLTDETARWFARGSMQKVTYGDCSRSDVPADLFDQLR